MCGTCGCSGAAVITGPWPASGPVHGHDHAGHDHAGPGHAAHDHTGADHAGHAHSHAHSHGDDPVGHSHADVGVLDPPDQSRTVVLQQKVLDKNDNLAAANRRWLRKRGILAINLMSSPGAGKTTLLERTAAEFGSAPLCVIEGDQETALDAGRIEAAGSQVVQVNTGVGCHLDAQMVGQALRSLEPPADSVVVIENVGNLVCPALFDLGEAERVVLASVTEGADKPLKYPHMFRQADLVLLNKTDLLPYVSFDMARYQADLHQVAPGAQLLPVSATFGDGLSAWYAWLRAAMRRR